MITVSIYDFTGRYAVESDEGEKVGDHILGLENPDGAAIDIEVDHLEFTSFVFWQALIGQVVKAWGWEKFYGDVVLGEMPEKIERAYDRAAEGFATL
jgi:hypothetical protein